MSIQIKRVYEPADKSDGYRVLVDRLWPRGVSKQKAHVDEWLKEVGPSNDLRQWFNHLPERYDAFVTKYNAELDSNPAMNELIKIVKQHDQVTLVYSAHDESMNQARVLVDRLNK